MTDGVRTLVFHIPDTTYKKYPYAHHHGRDTARLCRPLFLKASSVVVNVRVCAICVKKYIRVFDEALE